VEFREVGFGSWSFGALTASRGATVLGQLAEVGGFSAWKCSWCGFPPAGAARDKMRAYVCDNYVLIAARSGWTPIRFMTRVRL
jgi:hypothetical protein